MDVPFLTQKKVVKKRKREDRLMLAIYCQKTKIKLKNHEYYSILNVRTHVVFFLLSSVSEEADIEFVAIQDGCLFTLIAYNEYTKAL